MITLKEELEVISEHVLVRLICINQEVEKRGDEEVVIKETSGTIFDDYRIFTLVDIPGGRKYKDFIEPYLSSQVIELRFIPELNHRQRKELGLDEPIHRDQAPEIYFKDLELRLYVQIKFIRKTYIE